MISNPKTSKTKSWNTCILGGGGDCSVLFIIMHIIIIRSVQLVSIFSLYETGTKNELTPHTGILIV